MNQYNPEEELCKAHKLFGQHGDVVPVISRSSTFSMLDSTTMSEVFNGEKGPNEGFFLYSRHINPTVNVLNHYLAAMEGTESAVSTASGMSAITCTILQLCKRGDHIVSSDTIYGGTHALFENIFPEMGITVTFVSAGDTAEFQAAITPKTKVIYTESVSNPTLKVADIPSLAKIAHDLNIKLIVDNTFMPMIISPAQLGADVVVYSMTKFINGASDVVAGAICAKQDFIDELVDFCTGRIMLFGPAMDPRVAFDISQKLPHLAMRMREHSVRAKTISNRLEELGVKVIYPGLPTHSQHQLFGSMANEGYGYGGILTVDCKAKEKAEELLSALQNKEQFGLIAVSLGYFRTLMSCSGSSTSLEISPEDQARIGLSPGLVRMSIGYTGSLSMRVAQIERAVKEVQLI